MKYERNGKTYEIAVNKVDERCIWICSVDGAKVCEGGKFYPAPAHNYGAEYKWVIGKLLVTDAQKHEAEREMNEHIANRNRWDAAYRDGMDAIRKAEIIAERNRTAMYSNCGVGTQTGGDVAAVKALYPESAALLTIISLSEARWSDKAAAGRKAIAAVKAGATPSAALKTANDEITAAANNFASRD